MTYALDTNIISFLLRSDKNPQVAQKFKDSLRQGDTYVIPPLCYFEIYWHLLWKKATKQRSVFIDLYNNSATKMHMSEAEFHLATYIKADLIEKGTPIGDKDADIFIAAYCIVNDYTLVTDNVSDFSRITDLRVVNWKA